MSSITEQEIEVKDLKRQLESAESDLKRERSRNQILELIPKLYYRYGSCSDEHIKKHLEKIKIVKAQHKGVGTEFGYYVFDEIDKVIEKPRNISLAFGGKTTDEQLKGLKKYKTVYYLCKSSSRFFLRPDIGEIFDQLDYYNSSLSEVKAICLDEGYSELPGTDGEHFLMQATLLVDENSKVKCEEN